LRICFLAAKDLSAAESSRAVVGRDADVSETIG
jgi:hypothetical protein